MDSAEEQSDREFMQTEQVQSENLDTNLLLTNLQQAEAKLNESRSVPATLSENCIQIRKSIFQALSHPKPSVIIRACDLYVQLLSLISISFEHLTFSSCVHHLIAFLKHAREKKCSRKCNTKTTLCYASEHIPVNKFVSFWSKILSLLTKGQFETENQTVESILIHAYGSLVRYAEGSKLLEVGMNGCDTVLKYRSITSCKINAAYKIAYELINMDLNKTNRKILSRFISLIADHEVNLLRSNEHEDEEMSTSDTTPYKGQPASHETTPESATQRTPTHFPVLTFMQLCCIKAPDKAESRTAIALVLYDILRTRTRLHLTLFLPLLKKLTQHTKISVRILALELTGLIADYMISENEQSSTELRTIVSMLLPRCHDKAAMVRAKVISILSRIFKESVTQSKNQIRDQIEGLLRTVFGRLRDEKSKVRKAAVDYVGLILCNHISRNKGTLFSMSNCLERPTSSDFCIPRKIFESHFVLRCCDAVASVRQSAIMQLTAVTVQAAKQEDKSLLKELFGYWSESVLPRVVDTDTRCQEEVLQAIDTILFNKLSNSNPSDTGHNETRDTGNNSNLCTLENLLLSNFVSCRTRVAELSRNAIIRVCKEKTKAKLFLEILLEKIEDSYITDDDGEQKHVIAGAWSAISKLAEEGNSILVRNTLGKQRILEEVTRNKNVSAASIASTFADKLNKKDREALVHALKGVMFCETDMLNEDEYGDSSLVVAKLLCSVENDIGKELLQKWENRISENVSDMTEQAKIQLLRNIGNICVSFRFEEEPSDKILTFVQAMSATSELSTKVRALAIATLGKICLCEGLIDSQTSRAVKTRGSVFRTKRSRNLGEALTRRFVSIFIRELDHSSSEATRNNAVLVLCDLCRRYTAIVEPFMARVASLLADSSTFIRVQVLSSIINLLQEDYIKMRPGPIFYQIALSILDENTSVQQTTEYALLHVISPKNPSLFAVSFVELIFVLNECKDCQKYYQFSMPKYSPVPTQDSRTLPYEKRNEVYEVFLRGMSVEQRLKLSGRFRTEILSLVLDEKLKLSSEAVEKILHDALSLLSSHHFNPFTKQKGKNDRLSSQGDADADEATSQATRGIGLLKKIQKTELRETTIPALVEVKHFLESRRSPLLKTLMRTLSSLVEPYEDELGELISDTMLREEVRHELASKGKEFKPAKSKDSVGHSLQRNQSEPLLDENSNPVGQGSGNECPVSTPKAKRSKSSLYHNRSVPRTRRRSRRLDRDDSENSSDDNFRPDINENAQCLSDRIQASPKLMAIASAQRTKQLAEKRLNVGEGMRSGFKKVMAQIENEV